MKKNTTSKYIENFKMDKDVYALRRQVINILYDVKKMIPNFPRIDVRIGKDKCGDGTLGTGRPNQNIIWITKDCINRGTDFLMNTVLHELVHTVYGFGHDERCPLMESYAKTTLPKISAFKIFKAYHKRFGLKQKENQ